VFELFRALGASASWPVQIYACTLAPKYEKNDYAVSRASDARHHMWLTDSHLIHSPQAAASQLTETSHPSSLLPDWQQSKYCTMRQERSEVPLPADVRAFGRPGTALSVACGGPCVFRTTNFV
jgi:hypothetical protein